MFNFPSDREVVAFVVGPVLLLSLAASVAGSGVARISQLFQRALSRENYIDQEGIKKSAKLHGIAAKEMTAKAGLGISVFNFILIAATSPLLKKFRVL